MFGQQHNTNAYNPTNIDFLSNRSLNNGSSDTTSSSLFAPSTDGRLFRSVQDSTQALPPHIKKLELGNMDPAPSTLLPTEGRITKANQDNALPIFFAGARPTPLNQDSTTVLTEKRQSLLPELTKEEPSTALSKDATNDSSIGNNNNSNNNNDNNDSNTDDHRTIKVFGFPSSLSDLIRTHFEKYGRIEESRYSPGNWLIIRYASPSSAASALKSNGMVLVDTFIIGVTAAPTQIPLAQQPSVATTSTNSFISIIPTDDNGKNDKLVTLGSGKAGMSVVGCPTINPTGAAVIPQTTGWIGFIKDALFAW